MRKIALSIFILLLTISAQSQIKFEKGYFINNENETVECFIKNMGWKNNPSKFEYKTSETGEVQTKNIDDVKEFGFPGELHYKRFDVQIDRSSDQSASLSHNKEPEFKKETLFLETLVEGKATLYKYEDKSLVRFFYSMNQAAPEQLVYKRYITDMKSHLNRSYKKVGNEENTICFNKSYKKQLYENVVSANVPRERILKAGYKKKDFTAIFEDYNRDQNISYQKFAPKTKKKWFNLYLLAGLDHSSLSVENSASSNRNADFGSQNNIRLGMEFEFILPFNKNKWSVFAAPSYISFEGKEELNIQTAEIDYKSLDLPIGVRHYFFLGKNSKIHIDGAFVFNHDLSTILDYSVSETDHEIEPSYNACFGIGYDYKKLGSIEAKYYTKRNLMSNAAYFDTDFNTFSLVLKINIL